MQLSLTQTAQVKNSDFPVVIGAGGKRGVPGRGGQWVKNWDNCNSVINKIYLKNSSFCDHLVADLKSFC